MTYRSEIYETNAQALDRAEDNASSWATIIDPEDARRDLRSFVLGALLAHVDPDTFAGIIDRAEIFAGRPDHEDQEAQDITAALVAFIEQTPGQNDETQP